MYRKINLSYNNMVYTSKTGLIELVLQNNIDPLDIKYHKKAETCYLLLDKTTGTPYQY